VSIGVIHISQPLTSEEEHQVREWSNKYYQKLKTMKCVTDKRLFGIEIEYSVVDKKEQLQLHSSEYLQKKLEQYPIVSELGSYQIEINPGPREFSQAALQALSNDIKNYVHVLNQSSSENNMHLAPIGLPFYLDSTFFQTQQVFTQKLRYNVSKNYFGSWNAKGTIVPYQQKGSVLLPGDSGVTVINELHVQLQALDLSDLIKLFNYSQMLSPVCIALGANSGITNGQPLVHREQQITIFEETEGICDGIQNIPRVGLFPGYINHIDEYMDVALSFRPLYFPDENNQWKSFDLQLGSYYAWTRIRHDRVPVPHFRIEFRPLSTQPSLNENIALSEFFIQSLLSLLDNKVSLIPEEFLLSNFQSSVKHAMQATLLWPDGKSVSYQPVYKIIENLLNTMPTTSYIHYLLPRIKQQLSPTEWLIKKTKDDGYQTAINMYYQSVHENSPLVKEERK